jgi:hypothetical protein
MSSRATKETIENDELRSRFRGCLLGGAVGDALGAPIEFMTLAEIRSDFGPRGIEAYSPIPNGLGAITDDTQMSLFTAEGLIRAQQRYRERGICNPVAVVFHAYLRWLLTQVQDPRQVPWDPEFGDKVDGWLVEQRFLQAERAPGLTCMSALESGGSARPVIQ